MVKERFWKFKEVKGSLVPYPEKPIKCFICDSDMVLHGFTVLKYEKYGFYHCDISVKCVHCGFIITCGIPISREEYEELKKSKYMGKVLRWELKDIVDFKPILDRLKSWGYW